jgi:hypothetical protein
MCIADCFGEVIIGCIVTCSDSLLPNSPYSNPTSSVVESILGLCMIVHGPLYLDGRVANDRIDCLQSSETVDDQPIMLCIPNIQMRASTIKMQPECRIQATSRCPVPRRIACFKYSPLCRRPSPRGYTRAARTGCGTRT